ncbi:hypothetical protein Tco_0973520 [Tanacetum coccineum]
MLSMRGGQEIMGMDEDKEIDEQYTYTDRQIEGTEEQNEGTEEKNEGTEEHIEGTEEQIESTDGQRKGTKDHTEEGSATQATQTPTSTIFGDDETIAKVLLNMSQAKQFLEKRERCNKGKKKIEEEDESESESDGIPEAEKKFKQLESDEEMARKIQEEWEGEEERNRIAEEKATNEALIRNFDEYKARIEADRLLVRSFMNKKESNLHRRRAKFLSLTQLLLKDDFFTQQEIRGHQGNRTKP